MIWDIEPEIFTIGGFGIRWYTLSLIIGFSLGYQYVLRRGFIKNNWNPPFDSASNMLTYLFLGTIIGSRLVHCLFYDPAYYLSRPWEIIMTWKGGLASHGGFLGVMIAIYLFVRKYKQASFFTFADYIAPPALMTGAFIRVGNLFNSEMIGKPTDAPWGVVFAKMDLFPRHPSMMYESICYFVIACVGFFLLS